MAQSTVEHTKEDVVEVADEAPIRVLHVDDEASFLKVAKPILEMQGNFHVETAASVEEALDKMKEKNYDVIVSDYVMPERSGLDLLKELRDNGNNLPFIIFTGKGREEIAIEALNLGADRYFNKIGNPEAVYGELAHGVRTTVRARKAEEEQARTETKYQSLVENTGAGILTVDVEGKFAFVNRALCSITGHTEKELLGTPFVNFIHPDDKSRILRIFRSFLENPEQKLDFEFKAVHKKGHNVHLHSSPTIFKYKNKIIGSHAIVTDITELRKAKEQSKKSEAKWKSLTENSPDHIMLLDRSANILYINHTVPDLSKEEVIGKSIYDYIPPAFHEVARNCIRSVLETGKADSYHTEYHTRDGETRHFEVKIGPVYQSGEIVSLISRSTDITERKKAEEALKESEEKYRALVERAADGIAIVQGQLFKFANERLAEMLGCKVEELIETEFVKLIPPRNRERLLNIYRRRQAGEDIPSVYETPILNKIGEEIEVELNTGIIQYEGKPATIAIVRDITERKKAEEALREGEERFRKIFEEGPLGMAFVGSDLRPVKVNKRLCEMLGYSAEELAEMTFPDITHPDDIDVDVELAQKVLKGEIPDYKIDKRYIKKNGEVLWATLTASVARDENGEVLYGLGTIEDITERKKAENDSNKLLHDLGERVKELRCLFDMSKLVEKPNISLEEILEGTVNLLPPAWQYPDITCARILFEGQKFRTRNFKETPWRQQADIGVLGKRAGSVEVCYLEEKPTIDEGPFLKEERELIEAVAKRLGRIAESKRTREALRQSEQKYRNIVELAPDGIVTIDLKGVITSINPTFSKLTGFSKSEVVGKHFAKLGTIRKRDIPRYLKLMSSAVKGKLPSKFEYSYVRKDGTTGWAEGHFAMLKRSGKTIGFQGILREVTEHKEAQKALNESEERYKTLIEETPVGILNINFKGKITYMNKKFEEIIGYSREELLNKNALTVAREHDMVTDKILSLAAKRMKGKFLGKETGPLRVKLKRRDGNQIWVEAETKVLKKFGFPVGLQAIVRDITASKETDERLRESEERLRQLVENAPDAIYTNDLKGNFLDGNKQAEELIGYKREDLIGKNMLREGLVPKRQIPRIMKALLKNVRGQKSGPIELELTRRDGTKVTVEATSIPVKRKGKTEVIGIARDVTERKKAEEKLKTMNEKLGVIGKLTRHDARNKLSAVTMNAFLAKQKLPQDNEALGHLKEIETACGQVERIFDFARIYEKLGVEKLVYLDVEKAFEQAAMLFSDLRSIVVTNNCQGLTLLADSLLRQLFYNLIDNSLRHGEKISQIRLYYEESSKDTLKLVFEDDGIGISKKEKTKIFNEGYGKGSGYGLYLIRKMCEVYGWNIQETGKQGKGAQFTITIPKKSKDKKENYRLR